MPTSLFAGRALGSVLARGGSERVAIRFLSVTFPADITLLGLKEVLHKTERKGAERTILSETTSCDN